MKIKELKVAVPLMKNCVFDSKITEEYGDIHFLSDSICVLNDESLLKYSNKVEANQEFSVDFNLFEKVFNKIQNKAEFLVEDDKLLIKSQGTKIKLAAKTNRIKLVKKKLQEYSIDPSNVLLNAESFFYALELCSSALVPFGTLAEAFASYILYDGEHMYGCSTFKMTKKRLKHKKLDMPPFVISIDSATSLLNTYKAYRAQDDSIKFNISKDQLVFKFGESLIMYINNGYGIIEYPVDIMKNIFNREGEPLNFPIKEDLLSILNRLSLFPEEFEDTTERVNCYCSKEGIKFKSKNSAGNIVEKCSIPQNIEVGFAFQHKDLILALNKLPINNTDKVPIALYQDKAGRCIVLGNDKCKYILSAIPTKGKE